MDRFYRWKVSQLGDSFTHINQYDDLLIPTSEVMCQCKNKATHIFSFAAREEYVCKSCGEENCKRYKDMPSFTYFCLSFEEVANLDKLICPNLRSYTEKEAINIYLMNQDIYEREELKYSEARIWYICPLILPQAE